MAPKSNLSGFDPKAYVRAAGQPSNDPWKRAEAWRYTGPFSRRNRFKGMFPGFGTAVVAFGAYLAYEAVFLQKDDHHGHGNGHGHDTKAL